MRRQVGRSRQRQRGSETERRRGGDTWMGTRQVFCRGPMRDFGLYPYMLRRPSCPCLLHSPDAYIPLVRRNRKDIC